MTPVQFMGACDEPSVTECVIAPLPDHQLHRQKLFQIYFFGITESLTITQCLLSFKHPRELIRAVGLKISSCLFRKTKATLLL